MSVIEYLSTDWYTPYRGVEQLEARRAHNPEVVGSSPASATKKVLKSKDFRTFSFVLTVKSWTTFPRTPADPYRDPYHDSLQWTEQYKRLSSVYQASQNPEIIGNRPVKFPSLKLCKFNNFALGTVTRQPQGIICFLYFISYRHAVMITTLLR